MDPHLEHVPRLAPLTTRRLAGRDLECLGREPHRAFDAQGLGACALEQLRTDLFERRDFAGCEGNADLVDFLGERGLVGRTKEQGRERGRTGPSPKSFSGFWKDIVTRLARWYRSGRMWNMRMEKMRTAACQSRPEQRGSVR